VAAPGKVHVFPLGGVVTEEHSRAHRPYVVLSCATSIDGFLDDASPRRLVLSTPAELDRVDAVRAGCDAILVGAGTLRADDPRLLVRSPRRCAERVEQGLPPSPAKVLLTASGDVDPRAAFFTAGDAERLVYTAPPNADLLRDRLGGTATVIGGEPDPGWVLGDLRARGVRRLLVEGGAGVHRAFLGAGLVDELHLVVAPFLIGDSGAPRLTGSGRFPPGDARAELAELRRIDDVVLLRYVFHHGAHH
jgi:5-amino-6-(5-phosphoribosylamino)uracil reductase